MEKKKNISSNLYYGVMNKKENKSTKNLKKSAQKELREKQKKAA